MKRKRIWVPLGFLTLISVLSVSSVDIWLLELFDDGSSSQDSSVATTTTAPAPTTVPQEAPYASLAAVLPETLDGYSIDTGAKATGSLDFDAAVKAESDQQAERALLETRHFENGYGRAFTNGSVDVYMVVYSFRNAEDARLYATDGMINLTGKGANVYDVPDIPDGQGFSQGTNNDSRPAVVHGVVFSKANRFVLVFTRSVSTSTPEQARQLAVTLFPRT